MNQKPESYKVAGDLPRLMFDFHWAEPSVCEFVCEKERLPLRHLPVELTGNVNNALASPASI